MMSGPQSSWEKFWTQLAKMAKNESNKKKGLPFGKPLSTKKMAWLRGLDLNQRPPGYEPDELPGCSTPRKDDSTDVRARASRAVDLLQLLDERFLGDPIFS